jgi:mannose-6-phosphate isomerase-like protein (cupin superfamily)
VAYATSAATARAVDLHGGRGKSYKLLEPAVGCAGLMFQENVIRPGTDAGPYHYHSNADNIYYVLGGTGSVTVDGKSFDVGPGDTLFIPANESHDVSNTGADDLRLIECKVPADSDFIIVDRP